MEVQSVFDDIKVGSCSLQSYTDVIGEKFITNFSLLCFHSIGIPSSIFLLFSHIKFLLSYGG